MTTWNYFPTLPNGPDYPGDDQPGMQTNTASTAGLIAVDHIGFQLPAGGYHQQVTFNGYSPSPITPTGLQSVILTEKGGASSKPQLVFNNANGFFPLSAICAFGLLDSSGNSTNNFNIASTSYELGTITVTLVTNATKGNNVTVLLQSSNRLNLPSYSFINNVLSISYAVSPPSQTSFCVIQF